MLKDGNCNVAKIVIVVVVLTGNHYDRNIHNANVQLHMFVMLVGIVK